MNHQNRFSGIYTPLVTPILADESPDLRSVRELVRFQIGAGVDGLWVMGTSAEFVSFGREARAAVADAIIAETNGCIPVIVNVSDASTNRAIRHARRAGELGANAVALTPPYYFPHSQDEVLSHYRMVREAVDLPLFIYNIPQTVRVRVELPTARILAAEGTASGIKDSQNDLEWFRQFTLFTRRTVPEFAAFAGTRYLIDAAMVCGATGAIPSVANAFPELCVHLWSTALAGDTVAARAAAERLVDIESVTTEVSEGSRNAAVLGLLKTVLASRGTISRPDLTAPLRTPTAKERSHLLALVGALETTDVTSTVPISS